jgi:ankyrin repeat protein
LDINETNRQGFSPLEIALMAGSHEAALELIKQGASYEILQRKNEGRVQVIPGTLSLLDSLHEEIAFSGLDDLELSALLGDILFGTVKSVAIRMDKNRSLFNRALSEESSRVSVLISAVTNSPLMYLTVLANGLNLCEIQIDSELRLRLSKHVEENWGPPFQSMWFKACEG